MNRFNPFYPPSLQGHRGGPVSRAAIEQLAPDFQRLIALAWNDVGALNSLLGLWEVMMRCPGPGYYGTQDLVYRAYLEASERLKMLQR